MCPAAPNLSIFNELVEAAKQNNTAKESDMMTSGSLILLPATRTYEIKDEGDDWFQIQTGTGDLYYVSKNLVEVKKWKWIISNSFVFCIDFSIDLLNI